MLYYPLRRAGLEPSPSKSGVATTSELQTAANTSTNDISYDLFPIMIML